LSGEQAEPEAEASADEGLSDEEGAPEAPAAAPTRRQPARKNRKPVEFLRGIWGPKELKGDDQAVDKLLWYPARIGVFCGMTARFPPNSIPTFPPITTFL
tara:strand:+ start:310 stop:609 length:300 start_codon:yes stop_codon:yes gene_type:complete